VSRLFSLNTGTEKLWSDNTKELQEIKDTPEFLLMAGLLSSPVSGLIRVQAVLDSNTITWGQVHLTLTAENPGLRGGILVFGDTPSGLLILDKENDSSGTERITKLSLHNS
jgi:hypothetical protein